MGNSKRRKKKSWNTSLKNNSGCFKRMEKKKETRGEGEDLGKNRVGVPKKIVSQILVCEG